MRFSFAAAALAMIATVAPEARAGAMTRGFTFCAVPSRPACVDRDGADPASCEIEVQAFVAMVFRYRECLAEETERAVRDANDVIEAWKCRTGKKDCGG